MKQRTQGFDAAVVDEPRPVNGPDRPFDFAGPWFDSRTACAYIPCATLRAFYEWCRRHGIVRRNNGSIAKADIDRVLKVRRAPRRMRPASLANLRKRA